MTGDSPISRNEIHKRLSNDVKGKELLARVSLSEVVERRQRRENHSLDQFRCLILVSSFIHSPLKKEYISLQG